MRSKRHAKNANGNRLVIICAAFVPDVLIMSVISEERASIGQGSQEPVFCLWKHPRAFERLSRLSMGKAAAMVAFM